MYNEQTQLKALMEELPSSFKLQIQISSITARSQKAFVELGLVDMTVQQERTMDSLLKIFDVELTNLEQKASSAWDYFYIASARQEIAAMHFYKSARTLDIHSSIAVFEAASRVLEHIRDLERDHKLSLICTRYILVTAIMGVLLIVRSLKGPYASYLDQTRGSTLYQIAVLFLRSCSCEKTDFAERVADIVEQIWTSDKIFKNADGSVNISLRIRSRLSASPVYDAIKWWRDEFVEQRLHVESGPASGDTYYTRAWYEERANTKQKCW
jgi:transcriptional regulatory protein LEU3